MYQLINPDDGPRRLEKNGETIWTHDGGSFSTDSEDFQSAILHHAGFDDDQRDALEALLMGPERDTSDE